MVERPGMVDSRNRVAWVFPIFSMVWLSDFPHDDHWKKRSTQNERQKENDKVLFLDFDLDRPSISRTFRGKPTKLIESGRHLFGLITFHLSNACMHTFVVSINKMRTVQELEWEFLEKWLNRANSTEGIEDISWLSFLSLSLWVQLPAMLAFLEFLFFFSFAMKTNCNLFKFEVIVEHFFVYPLLCFRIFDTCPPTHVVIDISMQKTWKIYEKSWHNVEERIFTSSACLG